VGYALAVNLSADERDLLARAEEVKIETRSPSGDVHRTIIWVVVDGDDVFIRSVRGETARWYREALAGGELAIHVGEQRIPIAVAAAADPDSVERCTAVLAAKYSADPALRLMVRPHTLPTTFRVLASA
jgi:hypothetical protein